jgi:hypothetical protein
MGANIATLDDSLYFDKSKNLFVYSHALVTSDDRHILVFNGTKDQVYSHEKDILDFIMQSIDDETVFYACPHYRRYKSVWDVVDHDFRLCRPMTEVKTLFRFAHESARDAAKAEFQKQLDAYRCSASYS